MNVVIVNKSDTTGGAAVVSRRLMDALREEGIDARMLVTERLTDSPYINLAAPKWRILLSFVTERLRIFLTKGVTRRNLFAIDTASCGLPIYRHPLVKQADVICLNWVNQGMLSLRGLKKLESLGKPIVWTMHDMWCFTGICHHAGSCRRYQKDCGDCKLLGSGAGPHDLSYTTLIKKSAAYSDRLHFVAVSSWLARLGPDSRLLKDFPIDVIPNAFPIPFEKPEKNALPKFTIIFGAARLDDPVKGLPILKEALRIIREEHPREAADMQLVTFGVFKNPESADGFQIDSRHQGMIRGEEEIRKVYSQGDIVVSTSHYETLPGTLVEGQAYGCIPVTFDRGGQRDIVEHKSTGYLAEWNDDTTIAARNIAEGILWAYKTDRTEIIGRMYESAKEKFSANKIARIYIELFNNLLSH